MARERAGTAGVPGLSSGVVAESLADSLFEEEVCTSPGEKRSRSSCPMYSRSNKTSEPIETSIVPVCTPVQGYNPIFCTVLVLVPRRSGSVLHYRLPGKRLPEQARSIIMK